MPRVSPDHPLLPSVLDRLLDREPTVSNEDHAARSSLLGQIKEAVKRDIEWLLNSRQVVADLPDDLRQIDRSLLTYGLPDFTASSLSNSSDKNALRRAIEEAIGRFEPRLTHVAVTLVEGRDFERVLRFRIDALLRTDPDPEPIAFDSLLQLDTKAFTVKGD